MTIVQQLKDNYYGIMSEFRQSLYNDIKQILDSRDTPIELHNYEEYDDEFYDLPSFFTVNKYDQHDTYYIVKVNKNFDVIGVGGEGMDEWKSNLLDIQTESLYDLYLKVKELTNN